MTKMIVDIPKEYDKMLGHLKAEKEFSSKADVVVKIIETFFDRNVELE
uniref:Uncharacterized protein n=1 Tax=viral metagenome TaxID=1070528 RepID=A0A6M3M218_9ZZZZ